MVESTWLCERTWVQVLCVHIVCHFNMSIILMLCLKVIGDNVILKLEELSRNMIG